MGAIRVWAPGAGSEWRKAALIVVAYFVVSCFSCVAAFANPQGGTVSSGSASITTAPTVVDVNQTSQRAVIDWRSFNIAPNETTNFNQPNANAVTLNRVNNANPSQILGNLNANGDVILVNPNGVFFGQGSRVDVNGLVATSANVSNQNFMAGNMNFNTPGNPNATVGNAGTITAQQAGLVGLVAPNVNNSGVINAKLGKVTLGSGDTFTLDTFGDGLINLGVSDAVKQQLITNSGSVNAAGGTIQLTAAAGRNMVNSLISVPGKLNAPAARMQGGAIVISAAGSNGTSKTGSSAVNVSGTLNASGYGAGQTGGTVNVTGDNVTLASGAVVDASGAAGGGTVNIGGELHGRGPLQNAITTNIAGGASVKANAVTSGNGGQVTVWSDDQTAFNGAIQAKGGSASGNGGLVETSSHRVLSVGGMADTSSPHGGGGEWLLDPASLTISNGSDTNVVGNPNFTPDGTVATSNLTPGTIDAALNAGTNVTITTGGDAFADVGDITVNNAILTTGTGSLTLSSYRNMILNAGITLAGGALTLRADNAANGSGYINVSAAISTGGGNITMGGGSGGITAGSGYAFGNASGQVVGILVNGVAVNAGGGNIVMNGEGFNTTTNGNNGVEVNGGSISTTGAGTISISGLGMGNTNSGLDYGVYLAGGGILSTVNGALTVSGTDGNASGSGGSNYGVLVSNAGSTIETTGTGNVSVTGTGGGVVGTSGGFNPGVYVSDANGVHATGTGSISIVGTGGNTSGADDYGILVTGSVVAAGGAISATGTGGGGTGNGHPGIQLNGASAAITNTGTGTITLIGTGGNGSLTGNDFGVAVLGGTVSAVNGDLTINGTGGAAGTGGGSFGVLVSTAGSTIETTGTGNVSVTGTGGDVGGAGGGNFGVYITNANGIQTTGGGSITLTGLGGAGSGNNNIGIYISGGSVTAAGSGTIIASGTGGGSANSGGDTGLQVDTGGVISTVNGNLLVTGQGGGTGSGNTNYGVEVTGTSSTIETTGAGNVSVTGTGGDVGGTGGGNFGVYADATDGIRTTGSGSINVTGTGGNSSGESEGVYIDQSNAIHASGSGNIAVQGTSVGGGGPDGVQLNGGSITGTGGTVSVTGNAAPNGEGVNMNTGSAITNAGGNITVTGTGGAGAIDPGVDVSLGGSGASISATGAGTVTVIGQGGNGSNPGVEVDAAGVISAVNGNVSVTGTGGQGGASANNYGVYVDGAGATISTTGSGAVSVIGTGGNTTGAANFGIYVTTANGIQTTGGGNISLTGQGGASSGNSNIGIYISGGTVTAAGSGAITASGTGGGIANSGSDYGVSVDTAGVISTVNGNLTIATAQGGGAGTGSFNRGLYVASANSTIETTGTGNVSITGTGGDAGGSGAGNDGVAVANTKGVQTTSTGNITITGTDVGGSGDGVYLSGSVVAAGGAISVTGTGGVNLTPGSDGVYVSGASAAITNTGMGTITLSGTGGGSGNSGGDYGVAVDSGAVISAANGNLTIATAKGGGAGTGANNYGFYVTGGGSTVETIGTGSVSITGTGGDAGGSGAGNHGVYVSNANGIQTTGTGSITLTGTGSASSGGTNDGVVLAGGSITGASGQNILITGTSGSGAGTYGFSADATSSVNATGAGNITIDTDTDNFGAASTMTTGSGRWLVYSINPANNNDAVLANNFVRYSCTYGGACPAFPVAGDGLLYSITPILTATPNGISITYGSATPSLTGYSYTVSGYRGSDGSADSIGGSLNGSTTYTPSSSVGTYNINYANGALTSALGYGFSYANNPSAITVNPAALTITANSFGKTYGTTYSFTGSEFTTAGLLNSDTVASVNLSSPGASATATVAGGPYTITASGATGTGLSNYTISYVNGQLTVNPAALTVTANSFSKTYGTAYSFAGTEFTAAGLVNGDTVSSVSLSSPGAAATASVAGGPYTITASGATGTGLSNYTISYVNGQLTVNPAALTVTANSFGKTYGMTYAFAGTEFTAAGLVNGDTVSSVNLSSAGAAATATVAGSPYAITPSAAVGSGLSNYSISYVNGQLTVNPAALTITANSFGKTYGTTYGFFGSEFTSAGLVNGDTVSSVSLASAGAAATATVAGSPYAITASAAVGTGLSNYTISYVNGNLTVNPATLTITANSFGKTYGATYSFTGSEFTSVGLVNGDTVSSVSLASAGAAATATVAGSPYAITGSVAVGMGLSNYTISYVNGNLTVNPAVLTITANSFGKTYGTTYTFAGTEFTSAGLVNGDTVSSVSLASAGAAATATVAGSPYAITGSAAVGTGLSNYTISYVNGQLTVNPAALTVTANSFGKTYGATYSFTGSEFTSVGLVNGDTVSSVSLASAGAAATATVAGSPYAITGSGAVGTGLSNYTISYVNGNMTVTPYSLSVTANAESKVYGAADPALTYTYGALQNGDTAAVFTGGLTRVAGQNVGAYAINQGTLFAGANYTISYTGNNLTITPYSLTVTANAQSKVYGAADPALTYTNGALQNGDTAAVFTGGLVRVAGQNVGAYAINQGTLSAGANYTISYTGNNLTITPYSLTVTANAQSKVYGAADPALTYTHGALQNGDTAAVFTGGLTRVAGQNVGAYAINQGTLSAGANYTISYTGNNLTITPYSLTVTANAQSKVYGSADPALTYSNGALQNGDTAAVFTGGLTRVAGQNVGAYAINEGTLSAGANYTISYTGNNLTITPYTLTVTANAQSKVYGSVDPALTYTNGALQNGDTAAVFSGSLTRVAGQNVGAYAINKGTLSAGANYTISYTGNNLTITPYTLTVAANAQSKVYGAADPALTYTHGALQNGDTAAVFTGGLSRVPGQNLGAYAINQSTLSAGANYTISYTGNTLTITPAALAITADNIHKTFGTTYTFLGNEFTTAGLVHGDAVSSVNLSSPGAPAAATAAGSPYAIIASGAAGTGLGNYNITYNDGLMFVTTITAPPPVTVPGTVSTVVDGSGGGTENSGGGGDSIRTVRSTLTPAVPSDPCQATAAQDTLPNQMTAMLDLIKISPELAETLPFYKIQTSSYDPSHIACGDSAQLPHE
jgi:filamentous hemagglutinin family protein